MSAIRVFSGTYCHGEEIVGQLAEALGSRLLGDSDVMTRVTQRFGVSRKRLERTLSGKVPVFNNFTHERQYNTSYLKLEMAALLGEGDCIFSGFCAQLVPAEISHILSVCIVADFDYRCKLAARECNVSMHEAQKFVQEDDYCRTLWTDHVLGKSPWDSDLYDVFLPMNQVSVKEAVRLVRESAASDVLKPTEASLQALADFRLATEVEVALGKAGHDVTVTARTGKVTLTINKHTIMLSRLEEELESIAAEVEGVGEVETKVGPGFYQPGVYHQLNPELPSRVLLVDDEREFVQTLSERLRMRDMGATVVYDGRQALSLLGEEEPEVIVLDLRMPGIDGIEVLRRIKQEHENVEVIILTGHGSDKDRKSCLELGAFAYLRKPVDIDELSRIMQQAYQKVKARTDSDDASSTKEGA
ncbi:MAG: response regulator [Pirellulales bacterium]|nr:response regulator [Pirellulales bacterium]